MSQELEPSDEPGLDPTEKPASDTAEKPASDPAEKPASDPAENPNDLLSIQKAISQVYVRERKAGNKVDPHVSIYPIFDASIEREPTNVELWIEYMVSMERNKEPLSKIVEIFEKSLHVVPGIDSCKLWLTYLDCLRRQTDWSDEKQVASLDKAFDVCAQYLGRLQGTDPELSILKYWAFIRAKYHNDVKGAREIWNDISKQQGLKYARTAKFWLEFAEFERLFGNNDYDYYRKLLYRALQHTDDYPDIIGQRLVKFERQEGDSVTQVVEAQKAIQRIQDRRKRIEELNLQKIKKKEEESMSQKVDDVADEGKKSKKRKKRKPAKRSTESDGDNETTQTKRIKTDNNPDEVGQQHNTATSSAMVANEKLQSAFIPRSLLVKKKS